MDLASAPWTPSDLSKLLDLGVPLLVGSSECLLRAPCKSVEALYVKGGKGGTLAQEADVLSSTCSSASSGTLLNLARPWCSYL